MDKNVTIPGPLNQDEGFINKAKVAERLNKTTRTVDAWMKDRGLPYYKLGRTVLFRWSDVEQHIISHYQAGRGKHCCASGQLAQNRTAPKTKTRA